MSTRPRNGGGVARPPSWARSQMGFRIELGHAPEDRALGTGTERCDHASLNLRATCSLFAAAAVFELRKAKACWPKGPARLIKVNQLPWIRPSADVGVAPRR
jgi:hypothetical protein